MQGAGFRERACFVVCRLSWMRADSLVPCTVAEILPREQSLEAHLLGAIAQNGVKGELMRLCIFGLARYPCTGCIHDAACLSIAVTSGCAVNRTRLLAHLPRSSNAPRTEGRYERSVLAPEHS